MSESGVIKEFLVAVGFKLDEAGAEKFGQSIASATKLTLGLGAALESMAATAMFAAQRIAMSYANLQTESRNVGASAENIKTYTYAVSQLGGTVEEALGAIQNFAKFLRESPGNIAWVETFGAKVKDIKGQWRDTTQVIDEFLNSEKFQKADEWQKRKYIEKAGIPVNVWLARTDPMARKFDEESRRVNQDYGLDPDKLAKQGLEFTQEWQAIWLRIRAIRDKFLMGLGFEEPLKRFKEWLDAHHEDITRNLTAFVDAVKPFVKAFSEAAGKVAEFAGAVIKWLGPNTTAWLAVAALVAKFTGIGNILTVAVIPAVYRLATALGALLMGSSGAAIKALGGIAGFFGAPAVAAVLGGAAALYPTPAGEGEDERQRQENIKRDPDYYKPGHPGAAPEKKKSRWERTKDWFKGKVGIEAEARETVEGQKGGETPASTPMLDTIAKAEGTAGRGDYNAVLGYGKYGSPDKPLTDMTLAEAYAFGRTVLKRHGSSSAIGRYQIVGTTMRAAAKGLGLDWNKDKFDAATQDRMAMWIARKQGLGAWEGFKFHPELRSRAQRHMREAATAAQEAPQANAPAAAEPHATNAARRMADARRGARRPEVEPQTPVHIPERRRTREDERWERRPRYDYSRPGAPLVTPRARHDGGTGIARPGGVSPRTPIGHVSHTNSVRHGDMNAKTTINVSTPGDPGAAARAIAGIQNNVNADLVRNMRGAAR